MRSLILIVLVLLSPGLFGQKNKKEKPPEAELADLSIRRDEGNILIDGKVKNCGERPIRGLVIKFHFHATDKQVMATKLGGIDAESLEPSDEADIHAQVPAPMRAVFVTVELEDKDGRYLRTRNTGPFTIE